MVKGLTLPLWNPYSLSGQPLLATLQPGVFYPPNLLLLLLPFDLAFNWTIVLHFIMAGVFTFLLLREIGAGNTGSIIGGVVFMLGGYLFSVHNVMSTLFSVAWAPLAVMLFLRALAGASLWSAAVTGVIFSVMFMAGGIEVLFGTMLLTLAVAAYPGVLDFSRFGGIYPSLPGRMVLFGGAVLIFVLLSAVQMLPFLELASLSTRAWGLSYDEATRWSFDLKDFIQFFIPDPFGYGITDERYWANQSWLKTVYTGAIPFVLSIFFINSARSRALPFILTGLVFLSLAMGGNVFYYRYFYDYLPFFGKFRYPVKFLFVPFLFLSISSALGFDAILDPAKSYGLRGRAPLALGFILLAAGTVAAVALGALDYYDTTVKGYLAARGLDYPDYNHVSINVFNTKRVLFFFVTASIAVYGGLNFPKARRILPLVIVTLLAIDLLFAHRLFYGTTPSSSYHSPGEVIKFLRKDEGLYRTFTTPKTMEERVEAAEGSFDLDLIRGMNLDKERLTGYNIEHGVFDINGFEVMRRADYASVYTLLSVQDAPDSTNLLALMNVKYVVSIPEIDSPEFRLRKVIGATVDDEESLEGTKSVKVYENLNYLTRFFVVRAYSVARDPAAVMSVLASKAFNPGKVVILEEDPRMDGLKAVDPLESDEREGRAQEAHPLSSHPFTPGEVEVLSYGSSRIRLRVNSPEPGILVASESFYPGWKARVDGKGARILRADLIYRAVPVGAGPHEVEFIYSPWSFRIGATISVLTAVSLAAAWSIRRRGRRRLAR